MKAIKKTELPSFMYISVKSTWKRHTCGTMHTYVGTSVSKEALWTYKKSIGLIS